MISTNRRHHLKVLALAAAAAALNAGNQASAGSVGIHFRYNYNNGAYVGAIINTSSSVVFGGVTSSLWNNMQPIVFGGQSGTTSFTGQFLTTLGASGISVDYSAPNAYAPYGPVTDSNAAYFSYLDDGGTGGAAGYKVTIHGLSSFLKAGESYRIIALQATDTQNVGFAGVKIFAGTDTTGTPLNTLHTDNPQQFPANAGTFGDTNQSISLTADTITIVGDVNAANQRSTLAGLAITTVPEPGSVTLMIGGLALLVGRRRRTAAVG